jgi:hypothetical protein
MENTVIAIMIVTGGLLLAFSDIIVHRVELWKKGLRLMKKKDDGTLAQVPFFALKADTNDLSKNKQLFLVSREGALYTYDTFSGNARLVEKDTAG